MSVDEHEPMPKPSGLGERVDLAALMADPSLGEDNAPTVLRRVDGRALLYPRAMNLVLGEPGAGKTWLALFAAVQVLRNGGVVALVDYEASPIVTALRLRALGLMPGEAAALAYWHAAGRITPADVDTLVALSAALVVVDSVAEALSAGQLDEDRASDVAAWIAAVPRRIAQGGAAVLLLDHVAKSGDRGRWARGSGHKLAAIDGVALAVEVEQAWARGVPGSALLRLAKDRAGYVGPLGSIVARARFLSDQEDGSLAIVLDEPGEGDSTASRAPRQQGRDVHDLVALVAEQPYPFPKANEDDEVRTILGWSRDRVRTAIRAGLDAGHLRRSPSGSLVAVEGEHARLRVVADAFPGAEEVRPRT